MLISSCWIMVLIAILARRVLLEPCPQWWAMKYQSEDSVAIQSCLFMLDAVLFSPPFWL